MAANNVDYVSSSQASQRRLSTTEAATANELRQLDPHVAGLFERGLALADEIDSPGVQYLVAHIGREIDRALFSTLSGETPVQAASASNDDAEPETRFRRKIATVLELAENHPNVAAWFRSHQALVGAVHWRLSPPSATEVREAFLTLIDLLFGRVAPYFDTQAELDYLLALDSPTHNDVVRLQRYTVRYTQRRYFFSRLSNSNWLQPLAAAGFYRNPPERRDNEDGSWSIRQWPEGEALARLASSVPKLAVEVLATVPRSNRNPAVWNALAKAALEMPPADAAQLVPALVSALKNVSPVLFPKTLIDVTKRLAVAGESDGAFDLADALLFVQKSSARAIVARGPENA